MCANINHKQRITYFFFTYIVTLAIRNVWYVETLFIII
jgi:hypothetical protein